MFKLTRITGYWLSALIFLTFHAATFSMLAPDQLTIQQKHALGFGYANMFLQAPSNRDKIYVLLIASAQHAPSSPERQILKKMLLEKGFNPDLDSPDSIITSYVMDSYRAQLEQMNLQTAEQQIEYLKNEMEIIEAAGPDTPYYNTILEALQLLINEIYRDEV